jgi:DNA-binding XRE family transcriptional regulator
VRPPEPTVAEQFGRNVFMARRRIGRSQEILAIYAGLHRQEVGLIERGKREPKLTTIVKLTRALHVEPNELFKGIKLPKPPPLSER